MNETLSQSQAKQIAETANEVFSSCKQKFENCSNDFALAVSKMWEDRVAVEYFKNFKKSAEEYINRLDSNNKQFIKSVETIANYYASAGGHSFIALSPVTLTPNIDVSCIKDVFADGANGDDFGFKNLAAGPSQVTYAFKELTKRLQSDAEVTVRRINSIPAFGNSTISMEVAKSAGAIVETLEAHISYLEMITDQMLVQTAEKYKKVGIESQSEINSVPLQ